MTAKARIFQPARNAMQQGRRNTKYWCLEYAPAAERYIEPLMGWTGTRDTRAQVRLEFDDKESAIAFCEANNIPYEVYEPKPARRHIKAYADNFAYSRVRG